MAHEAADRTGTMTLPLAAARPSDVGRLLRELESIDNALLQSKLKSGDSTKPPKVSRLMEQTEEANGLDLSRPDDRARLKRFLEGVKASSPVFHISFNADPAPAFIEKLMAWFRREVHPSLLLNIGLEPNIGAGCILRTVNKQFDMSLRQDFVDKRGLLLERLSKPATPPAPPPAAKETS